MATLTQAPWIPFPIAASILLGTLAGALSVCAYVGCQCTSGGSNIARCTNTSPRTADASVAAL